MGRVASIPAVADVIGGTAHFSDDMPVWYGKFGDDEWPFVRPDSPLYQGRTTSSIVWVDYIEGKGTAHGHPNSIRNSRYQYLLTKEIVCDLKIAAVIHGYFPTLIRNARNSKKKLDAKTVKGRIDELAKFFSLVILRARDKLRISVRRLSDIPFSLVKEAIASFSGRPEHLKRALKLISDPSVQKNLSAPLQWGLNDVTRSSIPWGESKSGDGIATLSDEQFICILEFCKKAVAKFKYVADLKIHDSDCQALAERLGRIVNTPGESVFDSYYQGSLTERRAKTFFEKYGLTPKALKRIIKDGHTAAMMLILLFTGMRDSELVYLMRGCLRFEHGYWFLVSKEVKHRPKDAPISEGWLAIDIARDAYDILMFITEKTGNKFLFSSPWRGNDCSKGYSYGGSLNTLIGRWLKSFDDRGLFHDWLFSVHQCRETLVSQLAQQEVGLPFISMQLKHFRSQFNAMPNSVTAGYGQYRKQLMTSISNRLAGAREKALLDVYGENAKFAGGGAAAHKARIDAFFAGLGLFGERREMYIKEMARRGVKLMPTSIGNCGKNFRIPTEDPPPPCYGDYQCDPNCSSHIITSSSARALAARRNHAAAQAERETNPAYRKVWWGLVEALDGHVSKLELEGTHG
ncbi:site-specific integrase [Paraburkholderia tropica]|uniref:site-specific integrase n=1 Tax=Paraburkholderia tropica TaxID=92647 RepID=UPI002AB72B13|nr:site-specific integrase [Paraburkholderia tropica]